MAAHYDTNCGQFVLHRDGKPVTRPLDEVALAVAGDGEGGLILHKHGEPDMVRRWAETTKAKMASIPGPTLADDLRVVQGVFDLHDLNAAVSGNATALSRLAGDPNVLDVQATVINNPASQRKLIKP